MKNLKNESSKNEQLDWEMRPGGMLVQKRDDDNHDQDQDRDRDRDHHDGGAGSRGPMVKINVAHGPTQYEVHVPAQSTFGNYLVFC